MLQVEVCFLCLPPGFPAALLGFYFMSTKYRSGSFMDGVNIENITRCSFAGIPGGVDSIHRAEMKSTRLHINPLPIDQHLPCMTSFLS